MSSLTVKILANVRRMYPKGRAWWLPDASELPYTVESGLSEFTTEDGESFVTESGEGGILFRVHKALSLSEEQAVNDALNILDVLLPDNDNFTIDDAHAWYRRLGIYDSGSVSLADMKLAIAQKYYGRGVNRYRQNYLYVQAQLRAAGFDVYLYENRFDDGMGGWETKTVAELLSTLYPQARYGMFSYGQRGYGESNVNVATKCVQYIEESKDATFNIGANWRSTFFVAGATITDFATVPLARKQEFRQLLIQLKPLQAVGFLFCNYV